MLPHSSLLSISAFFSVIANIMTGSYENRLQLYKRDDVSEDERWRGECRARMFACESGKIIYSILPADSSIGLHSHPTSNDINYVSSVAQERPLQRARGNATPRQRAFCPQRCHAQHYQYGRQWPCAIYCGNGSMTENICGKHRRNVFPPKTLRRTNYKQSQNIS